jgi:aspartyl-tRNA(Asn)/glutamyl-tRNA(Gln) amidotransferase subunit C
MVSREEVLRIAKLARIDIPDVEIDSITETFSRVLNHFETLKQLNVEGVEPMFHATTQMNFREDVPESPLPVETILQNAPESFQGAFRLPRVVGSEEDL